MENESFDKFERETKSFAALVILNIVGVALAMAFGVSWVVNNLLPLASGQPFDLYQLIYTGLGLSAFVLAIRWLVPCAETFRDINDVMHGSRKADGEPIGEKLTQMIVEKLAWYREKRGMISRLKSGSRLTGLFFFVATALQVINLAPILSSTTALTLLAMIVSLTICVVMGAAGIYIPVLIDRFTVAWDQRVEASGKAEKSLGELIEGP